MPTVKIKGIMQLPPITASVATLEVTFTVAGVPPDIVEVYASQVTAERSGSPETVDIKPNESDYSTTLSLQAGTFYYISVCPRTVTDNTKDEVIEGQYWEAFCDWQTITTVALAIPQPPPQSWPTINALTSESATLGKPGAILISWSCSTAYDKWHVMWKSASDADWSEAELSSQSLKSFEFRASPTHDGLTYSFKVQGCVSHVWAPDQCSAFGPASDIVMQSTHSLRVWLNGTALSPGVRSLGGARYGGGFRAMMSVFG